MNTPMDRYSRQTRLPEIGMEGQRKIMSSSILVVGAGGLGAPALLYLAAAGVGRIGIIDSDRVDESNLQRQVIFCTQDIGRPKAQAAAERLKGLNPHIRIDWHDAEFNADNAAALVGEYDLILDGTDNFESKFLINDAAVKCGKPWIYAAIQGFDGQVSVFNYKDGPCYRCLHPEKPAAQIMNCAEAGVIGAVAGIAGVTQAMQAIQIMAGHRDFQPLSGKLWLLDARTMQVRILNIPRKIDCPVCRGAADDIVLKYSSAVCDFVPEYSVAQMKTKAVYTLIDVREIAEWDTGHIGGAVFWPLSRMAGGDVPILPKDSPIILYCQKGMRSQQAARIMIEHGYAAVTSLSGGYEAWCEESSGL